MQINHLKIINISIKKYKNEINNYMDKFFEYNYGDEYKKEINKYIDQFLEIIMEMNIKKNLIII